MYLDLRRFSGLAAVACWGLAAGPALAQALPETVLVQGNRTLSAAATGLDLSLRETPQSLTVVGRQQIDDFKLTDANTLLAQVPGINVEQVETDRTYYNSRGFDITNFQVDGVGLPLIWGIQFGALDTAIFERVEAVRGADSMLTGTGNPSATINYVRKRPTATFQAAAGALFGSWNERRLDGDVSGPINESGSLRGRLVYSNTDKDSYLDRYHVNRNVVYGVLSWDIAPDLTATAGYSWQDNRSRGVLWGALPLTYSDGVRIDYPVSASTSADWTFWNVRDQSGFGELTYHLGDGWSVTGTGSYRRFDELAKLLYAYNNPDPVTGLGVEGMSGIYPSRYEQYMFNLQASGPVRLFGRRHQLVVGANSSQNYGTEYEDFFGGTLTYPAVRDWATQQVAEPVYPGAYLATDQSDRLYRLYAAAHVDIADDLKAVLGVNYLALKSKGYSYGVDTPRDEGAASPYVGLVWDVTRQISLYGSYTDIFNPQSEVDAGHRTLPAAHGRSFEGGIKSQWLDGLLNLSGAVFKSEQSGLAEYAGTFPNGQSYYSGIDTFVTGYEFEVSGQITPGWSVAGGWTQLTIEDAAGADVRPYVPRQTLKLSSTYAIPSLNDLRLGAALRWQGDVSVQDIVLVEQKHYAVLDLMASVQVVGNLRAALNLRNVTDQKYLTSLMWNQSYFAAPRSVSFGLDYRL
jgi:outer membrane receptor for ferric coprogen and ferric-rhodotorulic acid